MPKEPKFTIDGGTVVVHVGATAIAINAHANQTNERTGRSLLALLLLQFFCL